MTKLGHAREVMGLSIRRLQRLNGEKKTIPGFHLIFLWILLSNFLPQLYFPHLQNWGPLLLVVMKLLGASA